MAVRTIIPEIDVTDPAALGGGRVLALVLALLLPLALAACGEPGEDEDAADATTEDAVTGSPDGFDEFAEESGVDTDEALAEGLPLVGLDTEEPVIPEVIMPMDADGIPVMELAGEAPAEGVPATLQPVAITTTRVRALDKITARVIELDLPQDTEVRFGTLAIRARTCRSRPPEERPETFAFLEIDDVKMDNQRERIFSGWMMASSPALNALEHPVYDVWVIACKISSAGASSASE